MAESLGDFGDAARGEVEQLDFTFGYFGAEVRVNPDFTALSFMDFAESAGGLDGNEMAQVASIKTMLRELVHPDDWREFWPSAKRHERTAENLALLMQRIVGAISDRPTVKPSPSSGGRQLTGVTSEPTASSPAVLALAGRPDLQIPVDELERRIREHATA